MVGVHGGSKGCVRCRKRKVKCDETRPTCKRCEKGGYDCGGYRDLFQFDSRSGSKHANRARERASSAQTQWSTITTPPLTVATWSPPPEAVPEFDLVPSYSLFIPSFLGLQPFSEDFCVSYTNSHLMKGSGDAESSWAIPGITSYGTNTLVRDCILALSFSFFGQQYGDKITLSRGIDLYGSTLSRLNGVLSDSEQNKSVPTLESIMVLTIYEVLMSTNMKSFTAHVLGLEALLKMLGPDRVSRSITALKLLETSRPVIVSACTMALKDTVLASPEWKTIPWSRDLKPKGDIQNLYDWMVDIPELCLHVVDPIAPGYRPRHETKDLDVVYLRATRTLAGFQSWFADWNERHSSHMLEFAPLWAPTTWYESSQDLPWKKVWHFASMAVAQAYTVYQAGIIMTTRLVFNLESSGGLEVEHPTHDREPELQHAAIEICRSVEWLLSEQRRGAGGLYLLMPSRCAWKTFPENSIQRRWMLAATRDIGKAHRGGWAMANPMARQLTMKVSNGKGRIDVPEADP